MFLMTSAVLVGVLRLVEAVCRGWLPECSCSEGGRLMCVDCSLRLVAGFRRVPVPLRGPRGAGFRGRVPLTGAGTGYGSVGSGAGGMLGWRGRWGWWAFGSR